MTLWAVRRESRLEYFAAPSSESAISACNEPGDRVEAWAFDSVYHGEDVRWFLESWQPEGKAS